ncbi:MAG TPA: hypothetical protein VLK36_16620 [Gaiellaceae bacterium]|nr:hypothetical protein [Gaiellaceae bacterium]
MSSRARIGRLAAVAAGLLAIGVVIGVLYDTLRSPPSGSMALPAIEPATAGFPTPPTGAVVFAREAGANVLALGVVPRRNSLQLQASVLDGDEHGVSGLRVAFSAGGVRRVGTACGAGCYRATVSPSRSPDAVSLVVVGRGTSTSWRVALPAVWPPPNGTAIMARAGRVWRSLRSLAYVERLAADSTNRQTSDWRVAAPDRAAYSIRGHGGGIVIGGRRWDRSTPEGRWVGSSQSGPITEPVPFWVGVSNAHVLGTVSVAGRPAWVVSFFDPRTPAWFEATVEKRTGHTLELRMFTAAHFMHDVYRLFDRAPPIVPPAARQQ